MLLNKFDNFRRDYYFFGYYNWHYCKQYTSVNKSQVRILTIYDSELFQWWYIHPIKQ